MSRIRVLSQRLARIRQALESPEDEEDIGAVQAMIDKLTMHMTPEQRARMNEPHELIEEMRTNFARLRQVLVKTGIEQEKEARTWRRRKR